MVYKSNHKMTKDHMRKMTKAQMVNMMYKYMHMKKSKPYMHKMMGKRMCPKKKPKKKMSAAARARMLKNLAKARRVRAMKR